MKSSLDRAGTSLSSFHDTKLDEVNVCLTRLRTRDPRRGVRQLAKVKPSSGRSQNGPGGQANLSGDEGRQVRTRFVASLDGQDVSTRVVLPLGVDPIALGQMSLDNQSMAALAEWVSGDRRQRELYGLPVSALARSHEMPPPRGPRVGTGAAVRARW